MQSLLKSLAVLFGGILLTSGGIIASFGFTTADATNMPDTSKPSLKIINGDSQVCSFQVPNAQPGANGCISKKILNVGNRAGILGLCFSSVINTPGTLGEYADGSGDLGANTEIAVYIDVDASGDWNTGDVGLSSNGTNYNYPTVLDYDTLDNYSGINWNEVKSMSASAVYDFITMWRIPAAVGNDIQGDSVDFNITFVLEADIH